LDDAQNELDAAKGAFDMAEKDHWMLKVQGPERCCKKAAFTFTGDGSDGTAEEKQDASPSGASCTLRRARKSRSLQC
jgi:hypothetical protein